MSENPEPAPGYVKVRDPGRLDLSPWLVVLFALIAIAVTAVAVKIAWPYGWKAVAGAEAYIVIATVVHPEPDTTNLGWMNGMVDHPVRTSDDTNRMLLSLYLVLWPGRMIGASLLSLAALGSTPRTERRDDDPGRPTRGEWVPWRKKGKSA